MSRKTLVGIVAIAVVILVGLSVWLYRSQQASRFPEYTGPAIPVRLSVVKHPSLALIYVAEHQSYFYSRGLDTTIVDAEIGTGVLDDLLSEKVDVGAVSECLLATRLPDHLNVKILGSVLAMEDQTRWAIDNNIIDFEAVPNYLPLFYTDALGAVKPKAVTIIR